MIVWLLVRAPAIAAKLEIVLPWHSATGLVGERVTVSQSLNAVVLEVLGMHRIREIQSCKLQA